MKSFIIAGLVVGLVAAICNEWVTHERDSATSGSVWIGMSPSTVAYQPAAANTSSNIPRPPQPNTTNSAVVQQPAEISGNSTPTLPTRAQLLDQIAKLNEIPTLTNPVVKDMGTAYGFWIGQNYSVEQITKKFPNLKNRFKTAQFAFNRKYESGLENIEKILQTRFPEEFADMRSDLLKKLSGVHLSGLSQQEGLSFFVRSLICNCLASW